MNRDELIQKSIRYLGRLVCEVKAANACGLFDINTVAEDFFVPLLSILYNCKELKNENLVRMNFPAIDLGCRATRTSFQVTSDGTSAKILQTLKKFLEHKLQEHFDRVYVLVITEKQQSYCSEKLKAQIELLPFEFRVEEHIVDYRDLASKLNEMSTENLGAIYGILEREFSKKDQHLQFRQDLEKFLEFGRSKIEFEKSTKKYIPAVFVETTSAKERMRFFANPLFFYRKIDDMIERLDPCYLNELLAMAGEDPMDLGLATIKQYPVPKTLNELRDSQQLRAAALCNAKNLLSPLSWDRKEGEKKLPAGNEGAWRVFRIPIEFGSHGIGMGIDDAIAPIKLTQAKIFLVTGMAGQGKTNFVCDLTENQFRAFEIPSIFIPARDLNNFPAPDRISQFIGNNRYAPRVTGLHPLLELFDGIAKENQKPFIIVIDGINEVSALDEFRAELKIFLDAVCQYDFVKVVLTCRSEFFDKRFAALLNEPFAKWVHRIEDLRSNMSKANRARLLQAYFKHFSISLGLSRNAAHFLKSDLLLLRIFCEIHEGEQGGFVAAIYKGDLFERYLQRKAGDFPEDYRQHIMPTLCKIVQRMLEGGTYASQSTRGFDPIETEIIKKLIFEDIVLRREVPDTGLSSIGVENISFTYDELRDFIIAYYVVQDLSGRDFEAVRSLFARLPDLPICEGVFRYIYILARKRAHGPLIDLCEGDANFTNHYVENLSLLPPELQSKEDATRVRTLLASSHDPRTLNAISWFLFYRRDIKEPLNIRILIEHINSLEGRECREFVRTLFSKLGDYKHSEWCERINELTNGLLRLKDCEIIDVGADALAFMLQIIGFADWEVQEEFVKRISKILKSSEWLQAIVLVRGAKAETIRDNIDELITASKEAMNV